MLDVNKCINCDGAIKTESWCYASYYCENCLKVLVDQGSIPLLSTVLNLCGCVDDEYINDMIHILKECGAEDCYITDICKRTGFAYKYVLSILVWLNHLGLIEHGISIRGSWISDKGEQFLEKIEGWPRR